MKNLKIYCAQFQPIVGNIEYNCKSIIQIIQKHSKQADLIVFPELATTGYLAKDFIFWQSFQKQLDHALTQIIHQCKNITIIIGHPIISENDNITNSALVIQNQKIIHTYHKQALPNRNVFNEKRYFQPGPSNPTIVNILGLNIGICICEDLWQDQPTHQLLSQKPNLLISIHASPYEQDKIQLRQQRCLQLSKTYNRPILYCNSVGMHDSMIFDGNSFLTLPSGTIPLGNHCSPGTYLVPSINSQPKYSHPNKPQIASAELFEVLCFGIKTYLSTSPCKKLVIGVSGGIDSTLTLVLARHAIGENNITAIYMPSMYSSQQSNQDVIQLCSQNQIQLLHKPIQEHFNQLHQQILDTQPSLNHCSVTGQNIQARLRGLILMGYANELQALCLGTSNKSELFMGYSTLYGDMVGALNPLGDLLKTQVYQLTKWINEQYNCIPQTIIDREPTAELAPNQHDTDHLPPYPYLDQIINCFLNQQNLTKLNIPPLNQYTQKVITAFTNNQFKRKQGPLPIRVSLSCLTQDLQLPINHQWIRHDPQLETAS